MKHNTEVMRFWTKYYKIFFPRDAGCFVCKFCKGKLNSEADAEAEDEDSFEDCAYLFCRKCGYVGHVNVFDEEATAVFLIKPKPPGIYFFKNIVTDDLLESLICAYITDGNKDVLKNIVSLGVDCCRAQVLDELEEIT